MLRPLRLQMAAAVGNASLVAFGDVGAAVEPQNALTALVRTSTESKESETNTGNLAHDLYGETMESGRATSGGSSQSQSRKNAVIAWFTAFTTVDEHNLLLPRPANSPPLSESEQATESSERRKLMDKLNNIPTERWKWMFTNA